MLTGGVLAMGASALFAVSAPQDGCLRVLAPIASGSVPQSKDFEPAQCRAYMGNDAFRYGRAAGVSHAARDLAQGEIVPAYPEFKIDMVRPGETLTLVTAAGPVRIERQVTAMQAALPGQRLFVRAKDGEVLSVRYEAAP